MCVRGEQQNLTFEKEQEIKWCVKYKNFGVEIINEGT